MASLIAKRVSVILFLIVSVLFMNSNAVAAGANGNQKKKSPPGLYVGTLEVDDGVFEDITLNLEKDGRLAVINQLEDTERETSGLGQWRKFGGHNYKIGAIFYRYGNILCSEHDDLTYENCTFVLVGNVKINHSGLMTGTLTAKIRDRSSGGDGFELMLPLEAQKTSFQALEDM